MVNTTQSGSMKRSGLARLGVNKLLILGFGMSIIASIIVGLIAWRSFTGISTNVEDIAEKAQLVNEGMLEVAGNTRQASEGTKLIIGNVEKEILPATKSSVQDMDIIEEAFEEIVDNLVALIELEGLDVDTFIFEAEDILEVVKRESLPLLRTVKENVQAFEKQIHAMKDSLSNLDSDLGLFVEKSEEASVMSNTIHEGALNAHKSADATKGVMSMVILIIVLSLTGFSILVRNAISKPIKRAIEYLSNSSRQVSSVSGQIAESSQSLAQGASEQASSIQETSASMEEMAAVTKQNANNAGEAAKLVDMCSVAAENGNRIVGDMNSSMEEINVSSKKIVEITKVIDGIAFQTNLLALNAAVEAARAGEHGKGFAVVAEEVRNLAQRSATAAKDTTSLIEDSVKKAENGTGLAVKCGEALRDIVKNVKKARDLTNEITNASAEQSEGISQVSSAVQQMDHVTQQNASNAEETAAASEELSAQSQHLREQVEMLSSHVGIKDDVSSHATPLDSDVAQVRLPIHEKAAKGAISKLPEPDIDS